MVRQLSENFIAQGRKMSSNDVIFRTVEFDIRDEMAWQKILTLDGPTPTNISKNSEPETVMKGTFASPAVALANRVLPVPGGPEQTIDEMRNLRR